MSKHETIIQWLKILIALGALYLAIVWVKHIAATLESIDRQQRGILEMNRTWLDIYTKITS